MRLVLLSGVPQMKLDRVFYASAGALFLLMMIIGFQPFITAGRGQGGRIIVPGIFPLVAVHGTAIACWYVLFFVQSLLITVRKRKLHMALGWAGLAIGLAIALTGSLVAIRSVQFTPPEFEFFGMLYSRFLLVMLAEIALFTFFVTAGLLTRGKPRVHRPMMLLASLSLLAGATARMEFLYPVFGHAGWEGLFGAVFCVGAVLLLVRSIMTHRLDRWFAAGYTLWVVVFIAACKLAMTSTWTEIASNILKR